MLPAGPPAGPAVSGVLGGGLAPPSVDELRADPIAAGILAEFGRFFAAPEAPKVWHNYGFDRHVLEGLLGAPLQGFGGDTLHLSRLYDASRKLKGGYSLESLSGDQELMHELRRDLGPFFSDDAANNTKRGMKERFGLHKVRAGGGGLLKAPVVPPMHLLQVDEAFRPGWIDYSALDAKATWNVHRSLKSLLSKKEAIMDVFLCSQLVTAQEALRPALKQAVHAAEAAAAAAAAANGGTATGSPAAAAAAAAAAEGKAPKVGGRLLPKPQKNGNGNGGGGDPPAPYSMWDLYEGYWKPFGELLTSLETQGVRVDREHLALQELKAFQDQATAEQHFRDWASRYVSGARHMNVNSQVQIRQLLFPGHCAEPTKAFKAPNPAFDPAGPRGGANRRYTDFTLHGVWGEGAPGRLEADVRTAKGLAAVSGSVLWSLVGKPGAAAKALAELDAAEQQQGPPNHQQQQQQQQPHVSLLGEDADGDGDGLFEDDGDGDDGSSGGGAAAAGGAGASGGADAAPEVRVVPGGGLSEAALAALHKEAAGKKLGKMFVAMGGGREGLEACVALEKLIEVSAIDKLLSAFIQPLQRDDISTTHLLDDPSAPTSSSSAADTSSGSSSGDGVLAVSPLVLEPSPPPSRQPIHRVHCSLNLNTETGRLSARRPNLQNQPALEKDRYKVRRAFCAEPGKALVVADYGQLELRLLAHMADCRSMITAFELGGDFHSRTALGMYEHIQEAIAREECVLEWDGGPDHTPAPVPLLKDKFASERRKAKILNFSIAYGKTAHGLSKDFGVTLQEAEDTVERWYSDRPEVRRWQAEQRAYAAREGYVNTMIGRRRGLRPAINSSNRRDRSGAERAAINTPIQGSAADVASAAMLAIECDEWLRANDWRLLLQVHDEVMLEGPRESSQEALARVVAAMENPWANLIGFQGKPLRVDLVVDAKVADNWYDAK